MDLEPVSEGASLLRDDARHRVDDQLRIGETKQGVAVLDDRLAHPTLADDLRGHSEQQPDQMGIVYVEVDQWPSHSLRVVEVLQPERIRDDALEGAAPRGSVGAVLDPAQDLRVLGEHGQHVPDEQLTVIGAGRGHHSLTGLGRQGHRLLAEHMLAVLERGDRRVGMQVGRQAQIHQVDGVVRQQVIQLSVGGQARGVDLFARRPEVALDIAPIASQLLLATSTDRGHFGFLTAPIGQVVDPTHEPDAGNTYTNHDGHPRPSRV